MVVAVVWGVLSGTISFIQAGKIVKLPSTIVIMKGAFGPKAFQIKLPIQGKGKEIKLKLVTRNA